MGKKRMTETEILFPEKQLEFGDIKCSMSPLPLSKLGLFAGAFVKILDEVRMGSGQDRVAVTCVSEILSILPFCLKGKTLDELPATAFPELLGTFLEQNVTEDVVNRFLHLMTTEVKSLADMITTRMQSLENISTS